ncbi:MAG: 4-hydroxy-3-methylbut-2-enyl diphosphate reductase [candidate division NC10 bacterium]|nr:4-hydroxy-3-methylbut-2-enyl diphosphate reductase [candidate division NC10 bacterium]
MIVKTLLLAKPRGFCAGVDRAIDVVNLALKLSPGPVYVRKEIVHNVHVVNELRARGAIFVDELDEVPDGATVIFSAHGVSPEVRARAAARGLKVIDATCPLVTKVHHEAIRYAAEGRPIVLVGHEGHDEVVGTMGHAPQHIQLIGSTQEAETLRVADPDRVAVITQTTLSLDDTSATIDVLKRRFPRIIAPARDDICYATQNRQLAVKALAQEAPVILVIGSRNSSNSNRLAEVARDAGARAYLLDDVSQLDTAWLEGAECVGITAGASAPEYLVEEVVRFFQTQGVRDIREVQAIREEVHFALPPELVRDRDSLAGEDSDR